MPKFEFSSIDEIREFMSSLKGTRGGKAAKDEGTETAGSEPVAPAPLQPPVAATAAFAPNGVFAPPAGGATAAAAGPFAAAAPLVAPEVLALVNRIDTRIKGIQAEGKWDAGALTWFRGQLGPEAANLTVEQIVQNVLPKISTVQLEQLAKLIGG